MKNNQRAERWLKRAAEIRAEALAMPQTDAQATLLKLAADWEHMGTQARERAKGDDHPARTPPCSSQGWGEIPSNHGDPSSRH